jgi:hypothetical protein
MALDPESLYLQLGHLVAGMPKLDGPDPLTGEDHVWLGRAAALVAQVVGHMSADYIFLTGATDHLEGLLRAKNAHKITTIVHRALALAESNAPAGARGAFIGVASPFDVLQSVSKVLTAAKDDVVIVDAYMGINILTDFALTVPEGVRIRLLTDSYSTKRETLQPAAERWTRQYESSRPIKIRFTAPRALHDRLIVIDGADVWSLTQSLKDFAVRSPASILRVDPETAAAKINWYGKLWEESEQLI